MMCSILMTTQFIKHLWYCGSLLGLKGLNWDYGKPNSWHRLDHSGLNVLLFSPVDLATVRSTLTCGGMKRMARYLPMDTFLWETSSFLLKELRGREDWTLCLEEQSGKQLKRSIWRFVVWQTWNYCVHQEHIRPVFRVSYYLTITKILVKSKTRRSGANFSHFSH